MLIDRLAADDTNWTARQAGAAIAHHQTKPPKSPAIRHPILDVGHADVVVDDDDDTNAEYGSGLM